MFRWQLAVEDYPGSCMFLLRISLRCNSPTSFPLRSQQLDTCPYVVQETKADWITSDGIMVSCNQLTLCACDTIEWASNDCLCTQNSGRFALNDSRVQIELPSNPDWQFSLLPVNCRPICDERSLDIWYPDHLFTDTYRCTKYSCRMRSTTFCDCSKSQVIGLSFWLHSSLQFIFSAMRTSYGVLTIRSPRSTSPRFSDLYTKVPFFGKQNFNE